MKPAFDFLFTVVDATNPHVDRLVSENIKPSSNFKTIFNLNQILDDWSTSRCEDI